MDANYNLVKHRLYFDDTNSDNYPQDRWVIYYGPNKKLYRISSFSKGVIDFRRYDSTIHAERFGSIKAISKFLDYATNAPLEETSTHSLSHIKALTKIYILPLKDGVIMQAFLPNSYHVHMPLSLKGLSDNWITPKTSRTMSSYLETFIANNKDQFTDEKNEHQILSIFKDEIASYFTKSDDGWVLKSS